MEHDKSQECYEFLDLSDVDDSERNHLTTALYSTDSNSQQQLSWVHNETIPETNTSAAVNINWHEQPYVAETFDQTPSETGTESSITEYPTEIQSHVIMPSSHSSNSYHHHHQQQQHLHHQQQQQQQQQQHHLVNNNQNQGHAYAQQPYVSTQGGQQGGGGGNAMYMLSPSGIPGNVYVSNVTGNLNVGYMAHGMPQYIAASNQAYAEAQAVSHEQPPNIQQQNNNQSNIRGNARRGRGRGNNVYRREYVPRQQQVTDISPMMEPQGVISPSGYTQYFGYPYPQYYTPQSSPLGHHPSAQHATGSPLYLSGHMPMYQPHMYSYIYPAMIPQDYAMIDDKEEIQSQDGMIHQLWHPHLSMEYQDHHIEQQMQQQPEELFQLDIAEDPNADPNIQQILPPPTQLQQQPQLPPQPPSQQQQQISQAVAFPLTPTQHALNPNVATFTSSKSQFQSQPQEIGNQIIKSPPNLGLPLKSNQPQKQQIFNTTNTTTEPLLTNQQEQQTQHHQNVIQTINENNSDNIIATNNDIEQIINDKNNVVNFNNNNLNINNKDVINNQVPLSNNATTVTVNKNNNNKVPVVTTVVKTNNNNNNNNNNSNSSSSSSSINNNSNINNNNINRLYMNNSNTNIQSLPNSVFIHNSNSNTNNNNNISNDNISKFVVKTTTTTTTTTHDKLMIKNDRGNKPPAWNNSKKTTTATVAVSAVPSLNNHINKDVKLTQQQSTQKLMTSSPNIVATTMTVSSTTATMSATTTPATVTNVPLRQKLSPPPFTSGGGIKSSPPFVPKVQQHQHTNIHQQPSSTQQTQQKLLIDTNKNILIPISLTNNENKTLILPTTAITTSSGPIAVTKTVKNILPQQQPPPLSSVSTTVVPQQLIIESRSLITATSQSSLTQNKQQVETKQTEILTPQQKDIDLNVVTQALNECSIKDQNLINGASNNNNVNLNFNNNNISVVQDNITKVKLDEIRQSENNVTSPATGSWAGLFSSEKTIIKPQTINKVIDEGTTTITTVTTTSTSSNNSIKKPIAKITPFDATNNLGSSATDTTASSQVSTTSGIKIKTGAVKIQPDDWCFKVGDFLTKYHLDNNSISIVPRGLTNRSNYCFINAILQALVSCPPFYNLMRAMPTLPSGLRNKNSTPIIDAMTDLTSEFALMPQLTRIVRRENHRGSKKDEQLPDIVTDTPFEPSVILKMLNTIQSDMFQVEGRQEDAEEFLGCILNKLNDEMLELMKLVDKTPKVMNGRDSGSESHTDEGDDWQVIYGNRNKGSVTRTTDFGRTPISDIFRGQLRSRVQREGDHSTDVVQPFFTLQLDIEKASSVKEALEILVGKDQLEGVTCSKTNQEIVAWQQVTLEELPIVMILHLKCFDYKMDVLHKILKTVEFPIELKIDAKFLSSKNKYTSKQKQYKLFAVVYHDGKEAVKGHYITDVFHIGYSSWIRYDDSTVKPVHEHNVLHPRSPRIPYLLYYRRCDTIGPHKNNQ